MHSNDLRGEDTNLTKPEVVFKMRMFKTIDIQKTWLPEFKDRPIITGRFSITTINRDIIVDSTEGEDEEEKESSRQHKEVEGNLKVLPPHTKETYEEPSDHNLQFQWQNEKTMHGEMANIDNQLEALWVNIIPPPPFDASNAPSRRPYRAPPY
ncbi:hypothetical protein Acr_26g0000940 [Actinidia rufa]|uniref:Uncharacterized protein n=1 Tax=Actinidia rufa TaxID=165716 RepID=A0A7J0H212_9ERIC|nr:hypothetical protein Acr_26g0000940 [Actinidia rufa]